MQQRPGHLDGVRRMKGEGTFLDGGAMLDDEGRAVGSMVVVEFASQTEVAPDSQPTRTSRGRSGSTSRFEPFAGCSSRRSRDPNGGNEVFGTR